MWGQGLKRTEKFAALITRGLKADTQASPTLVFNRARSGAALTERGTQREAFLDKFPHLFTTAAARGRFRRGDDAAAAALYGENPAPFPTVRWPVDSIDDAVGANLDLVLLIGGANDLDFEQIVNPQDFPGAFIEEFDGKIRSVVHDALLEQIRRTRDKCPNAVILVFGYFSALSYDSKSSDIRKFFKHEADDDFGWWVNNYLQVVDIDQMIREAKIRSFWAQGRAQHWMRAAVTEANRVRELRGPGVVFVPSGMAPENSAFAAASEVHEDYTDPTSDHAQQERQAKCPRIGALNLLRATYVAGVQAGGRLSSSQIKALLNAIDGPVSLVEALTELLANQANTNSKAKVLKGIEAEVNRIQHALIASFLHPNPAGARRYANNALARYREHVNLVRTVAPLGQPGHQLGSIVAGQESLGDMLARYGMRSSGSLLADIGHVDVDAISLTVVTQRDSDAFLSPDLFLVVETRDQNGTPGERRYRLNFPYVRSLVLGGPAVIIKKFYPHFEPAQTNRFTIDTANRLRLDHITSVKMEMGPDELAGKAAQNLYGTVWHPRRVLLELNGITVLDRTYRGQVVKPGGKLDLGYPPPSPGGQIAAPPGAARTGS